MSGNIYQNIHVEGSGRVLLGNQYTTVPKDQKIVNWLLPLDPWAKHNEARQQYRKGTLDWFFNEYAFLAWLNGDIQTLWCPGPMGTGKTVLMSRILDRLQDYDFAGQDVAIAFVYCQHQARDVQNLSNFLRCLLSQRYVKGSETAKIPPSIINEYNLRPKVPPTTESLRQWVSEYLSSGHRTIILLDGLDEIDQLLRDELLHSFGVPHSSGLQILVTSRPLPDIQTSLMNPTVLHICAPDSNVKALISARLESPSSRRLMSLVETNIPISGHADTLEQAIRNNVTAKAKVM